MGQGSKSLFKKLISDESAQALTEYLLLLAIIGLAAILLYKGILKALDLMLDKFRKNLEKFLKTGKAPESVYVTP